MLPDTLLVLSKTVLSLGPLGKERERCFTCEVRGNVL